MSKQDRQGVRRPSDIEQKYNLGGIKNAHDQQTVSLNLFRQSLKQDEAKLEKLESELSSLALEFKYDADTESLELNLISLSE